MRKDVFSGEGSLTFSPNPTTPHLLCFSDSSMCVLEGEDVEASRMVSIQA